MGSSSKKIQEINISCYYDDNQLYASYQLKTGIEFHNSGGYIMKMPEDNIDTIMFAPCGMNCKVCYKHCYQKKPCAGCLNDDIGKPEHCQKCKIKNCVKEKGLSYCYECTDYPCKQIKYLEKSYKTRYKASLIDNSKFVRQHGLEKFMENQKELYTCPKCGGIISLHDRECSECQEKMN